MGFNSGLKGLNWQCAVTLRLLTRRNQISSFRKVDNSMQLGGSGSSVRSLVQSTAGRRAVQIGRKGLYCSCKPVFCSHVTLTGYPLHSIVSPLLLLPRVTACNVILIALYQGFPPQGLRMCGTIHPLLHMPSWCAQGLCLTLYVCIRAVY
jgi:hypothetical protein